MLGSILYSVYKSLMKIITFIFLVIFELYAQTPNQQIEVRQVFVTIGSELDTESAFETEHIQPQLGAQFTFTGNPNTVYTKLFFFIRGGAEWNFVRLEKGNFNQLELDNQLAIALDGSVGARLNDESPCSAYYGAYIRTKFEGQIEGDNNMKGGAGGLLGLGCLTERGTMVVVSGYAGVGHSSSVIISPGNNSDFYVEGGDYQAGLYTEIQKPEFGFTLFTGPAFPNHERWASSTTPRVTYGGEARLQYFPKNGRVGVELYNETDYYFSRSNADGLLRTQTGLRLKVRAHHR